MMARMSGLAELLSGNGHTDDDDRQSYAPLPEAQAHDLRERFARLMVTHEFQPGDIVRCKDGLGQYKPQYKIVSVVIRKLDHADAFDQDLMREWLRKNKIGNSAYKPDLVIGNLHTTSGAQIACELMSSALLEPAGL